MATIKLILENVLLEIVARRFAVQIEMTRPTVDDNG
jgi:hypothetical protein